MSLARWADRSVIGIVNSGTYTIVSLYCGVSICIAYTSCGLRGSFNNYLNATGSLPTRIASISFLACNCGALEVLGLSGIVSLRRASVSLLLGRRHPGTDFLELCDDSGPRAKWCAQSARVPGPTVRTESAATQRGGHSHSGCTVYRHQSVRIGRSNPHHNELAIAPSHSYLWIGSARLYFDWRL